MLLAVYALGYLQFAVQLAAFPFDLDQGEGYDAWSGWLINLGQLPYTTNATFPYYSSNYPPLWSYLVSIPMAWLGPGLGAARIVSTLAAVLPAGVLGHRRPTPFGSRPSRGRTCRGLFPRFALRLPHNAAGARHQSGAAVRRHRRLTLLEDDRPDSRVILWQPGPHGGAVYQADRDRRGGRGRAGGAAASAAPGAAVRWASSAASGSRAWLAADGV